MERSHIFRNGRVGQVIPYAGEHIANTYTKIGVSNRARASLDAMQHGLLPEETYVDVWSALAQDDGGAGAARHRGCDHHGGGRGQQHRHDEHGEVRE